MKRIPLHSLVLTVGPSAAGKTTLVTDRFEPHEVVSLDAIRADLTGDFRRQDYNHVVLEQARSRAAAKLALGERVVLDAANLLPRERLEFGRLAAAHGVPLYYLVVNRPLADKQADAGWRNAVHAKGGKTLVEHQDAVFAAGEAEIRRGDGLARVIDTRRETFEAVAKVNPAMLVPNLQHAYRGVLAVGDVHGTMDKLRAVVALARAERLFLVFLGDVVDYGEQSLECIEEVWRLWTAGEALLIWGNHERKIVAWVTQILAQMDAGTPFEETKTTLVLSESNLATVRRFGTLPAAERRPTMERFRGFLAACRQHLVVGRTLFVHGAAHTALWENRGHRVSGSLETLAMFGQTDGLLEPDAHGQVFPNRVYGWTAGVPAGHRVLVGHDIRSTAAPVVVQAEGAGTVYFLDTGCGKGGPLSTAELPFLPDDQLGEPVLRSV